MRKIAIISVGKLKEPHWRAAQMTFVAMLSPFVKLVEKEIEPFHSAATVTVEQAMETEGKRILKMLDADAFLIVLERTGEQMPSEKFASLIERETEAGRPLAFVIGGAHGLSTMVLARADKKISFSQMTFTHEMARIFLIEQLYRAETILAGKKYHY